MAAKNIVKAIDADPIMKQKFLVHLQGRFLRPDLLSVSFSDTLEEKKKEIAQKPTTLNLDSTNFSKTKKISKQYKKQLLASGSRYIDVSLPDIES